MNNSQVTFSKKIKKLHHSENNNVSLDRFKNKRLYSINFPLSILLVHICTLFLDPYFNFLTKGFGFVTMEDQDEANKAIKELNGITASNLRTELLLSMRRGLRKKALTEFKKMAKGIVN